MERSVWASCVYFHPEFSMHLPRLARRGAFVVLLSIAAQAAAAQATSPFAVDTVGRGHPMLLIPGLASSGAVWQQTAEAFSAEYQVHVFTLAGFAGRSPIAVDSGWVQTMRDSIAAYARGLPTPPVIVGHSLGGVLAMGLALEHPELVAAVINVDGLPFIGATVAPTATVESVRPQALQMRRMMLDPNGREQFGRMQEAQIGMMVRDSSAHDAVRTMMRTSDPRTVANASFDLWTVDLRPDLAQLRVPMLALHAWAGYRNFGMTRERADVMFGGQYAANPNIRLAINDAAHHFIMLDEPAWLHAEMRAFLGALPPR